MVLGAGRGPLVTAVLRAARQFGVRVRIYAVEKNPNAVVTLENCQWEEWGSQVSVISRDMRRWEAPEPPLLIPDRLLIIDRSLINYRNRLLINEGIFND
ncbi:protein arginine N-methyltransferase 5-like [Malurus melanocephalus]|uniref:protein arginine N-methyltransferase 5-like n=1 Tax=Malurus melanocephalus TaxID=175006 RepID=UPI0025470E63|nr:protein arginine N-methyltransferase 5-like [Malurus melanocephalus]